MDFKELVRGYTGSEVEIMTSGDLIVGTLISVNKASLMMKIPPIMYGPPGEIALIPLRSIEFVRVLTD
ncbi:hypothetical protein J23TS9_25520 [Paenibacillus sp. J23TS9]|uniref:hypothetical protein n=1 Tax=Paenibacillus sp. J23TS9 TaxID=2807193 RepID=UPI001B07F4B6|nr:hypothetical protein [Paenibacillus sp. J23TS9]GIP27422.1 hypothetical protein J23TS9_25520 [Paenibacillus sp. J23TS9]